MTIKDYLLKKDAAHRFEIVYQWKKWFVTYENGKYNHTGRYIIELDDEYSRGISTVEELRQEVKTGGGHYGGYNHVYDIDIDMPFDMTGTTISTETSDSGQEIITIIREDYTKENGSGY